ncbi:hypothetical protein AN8371.2 [Aspergillus nidulans FGSC A4]|uniref:Uncharacterized protein n=1 Tax=Emericella nidulans (strain FGSC A4 / ATCC 38163 / CBS 112.46 / NRRL 194 / M139) TaxID=227321 RepID=Q5ATK9_EMENI|nr:hypothetical protein [Aspergillus nidulans FGSC A4]EAA66891.1 hypothetical protein AN8371.2 [Aspergillus nidulans FGSC A4]CBF80405.1 TPA: conserved hypothetical protein [Aspergillus nidulans FGSC A4]|eukprot:XP_681640.1 hypothetical protein AN8371.2 [Aspergillus nidulans FGSC A4]
MSRPRRGSLAFYLMLACDEAQINKFLALTERPNVTFTPEFHLEQLPVAKEELRDAVKGVFGSEERALVMQPFVMFRLSCTIPVDSRAQLLNSLEGSKCILFLQSIIVINNPNQLRQILRAASMGLANLARVIAIAGELGNAALATYDTVNNPDAAVVNMPGMLFGAGAFTKVSRDAKGLKGVASYRRGMPTGEIASLGKFFENGDGNAQAILGKMCW